MRCLLLIRRSLLAAVERGKSLFLALPLMVKKDQGRPHLAKPDQSF
jgi:hypothetical protein